LKFGHYKEVLGQTFPIMLDKLPLILPQTHGIENLKTCKTKFKNIYYL